MSEMSEMSEAMWVHVAQTITTTDGREWTISGRYDVASGAYMMLGRGDRKALAEITEAADTAALHVGSALRRAGEACLPSLAAAGSVMGAATIARGDQVLLGVDTLVREPTSDDQ